MFWVFNALVPTKIWLDVPEKSSVCSDKQSEDLQVEARRRRRAAIETRRSIETRESVRDRCRQSVSVLASGRRTCRRFKAERSSQSEWISVSCTLAGGSFESDRFAINLRRHGLGSSGGGEEEMSKRRSLGRKGHSVSQRSPWSEQRRGGARIRDLFV